MQHRPSLEAQVYDTIRDNMIKGEYLPGTMLSENELAKALGVSRTPVRAAISILEKEGLVESFKGRGVLVKEISFQEFYQIFEVLVSMQLFVMDIAMERKLSFDLESLRLCLNRQKAALEQNDNFGYYDNSLLFTESILRTLRNDYMVGVLDMYRTKFLTKMVSHRKRYPEDKPEWAVATNSLMYERLCLQDVAGAKKALSEQYRHMAEKLMWGSIF